MHKPLVLRLFTVLIVFPIGFTTGQWLMRSNWNEFAIQLICFTAGAASYALADWLADLGTQKTRGD